MQIPQGVLYSARLTTAELRVKVVMCSCAESRLPTGKARELVSMNLRECGLRSM